MAEDQKTTTTPTTAPAPAPTTAPVPAPAEAPKQRAPREKKEKKEKKPAAEKAAGAAGAGVGSIQKDTSQLLGIEAKKLDSFSDWYTQVITRSGMLDYYDVSGCYILRPWAYKKWEQIEVSFPPLFFSHSMPFFLFSHPTVIRITLMRRFANLE